MLQDDVIRIAREVGLIDKSKYLFPFPNQIAAMERFACAIESTVRENAAAAAIQFALETDDGLDFLRLWNQGDFDAIRKEWSDAPESVFIGADPLHPATVL